MFKGIKDAIRQPNSTFPGAPSLWHRPPPNPYRHGTVVNYPIPPGELPSRDYAVSVNGERVFCYTSWQFDQSSSYKIKTRTVSPVSFASFDFQGVVEVTVTLLSGLSSLDTSSVTVRPLAWGIRPQIRTSPQGERSFSFQINQPCQLSIETATPFYQPLHIFANPLETDVPSPNDPNVIYFWPGVHELSPMELDSHKTVYIAGGAVVYLKPLPPDKLDPDTHRREDWDGVILYSIDAQFNAGWKEDITIRGRGILCGRRALEQGQRANAIAVNFIERLKIEGIVMRESAQWTCNIANSNHVVVDNVKIVGHFVNHDGVVIAASNTIVKNSFAHCADDSFEIKAWEPPLDNITFENCIAWNDVSSGFGIPAEVRTNVSNVMFRNCTVIHNTHCDYRPPIAVSVEGKGTVRNITFEHIVVERSLGPNRSPIQITNCADPNISPNGTIVNLTLRNVDISSEADHIQICGAKDNQIQGIQLVNVVLNGRPITAGDSRLQVSNVQNLRIASS